MALAFTLPDTDGTPTPLHVDGAPAAVVVFTCNHCPYALAWHERLQAVARDYADRGVRFLQINANDAVKLPARLARGDEGARRRGRVRRALPARRDAGGRARLGREDDAGRVRHRRARGSSTAARRTPTTATRRWTRGGCAPRWTTCSPAARSPTPRRSRSAARSSGSRALLLGRAARRIRRRWRSCARRSATSVPVAVREIATEEQAVAERFPGSPTIRVDGSRPVPDRRPAVAQLPRLPARRRPLLPHARPGAAARGAGPGLSREPCPGPGRRFWPGPTPGEGNFARGAGRDRLRRAGARRRPAT